MTIFSNSIRWRLSLTYGAISLFASISVGAILLLTLQQFYQQQEVDYLLKNGRTVGRVLYGYLGIEEDRALMTSQLATFAYLTQTRIELLDSDLQIIFDSGSPDEQNGVLTVGLEVETESGTQAFIQDVNTSAIGYETEIVIENGAQSIRSEAVVSGNALFEEEIFTPLHLIGDPASGNGRSNEYVMLSLTLGTGHGENGMLRLSEGPAFGRAIIEDVSIGLIVAGGLATFFTSLLGWWVSGRLTQPLDQLAAVSQQMGDGHLAVRATIDRRDEIGRVADSFNQMAERVTATVSSLRRFVADAAHEINTPITALRGNLELLEPSVPSAQRHLISHALDQTHRIQLLSADLLSLSELDGATAVEKARLDLADLVRQQNERIAAEAEQAGIDFRPSLGATPIWVSGHAPSLLSLYRNLIDNALKFTPIGGLIDVSVQVNGACATLTVTDTGIGFEGDMKPLFERFYRAPEAAAYPGSGLGLAIAAKIAEQHGSLLTADSVAGKTRFVFEILCDVECVA